MSYVGLVLVSHNEKVVVGIEEIIRQVIGKVPIAVAGGTDDDEIGTSIKKISSALEQVRTDKGTLIFYDLGSAKMNAELAIELSGEENINISEAPLLEGAYMAAVESNMGKTLEQMIESLTKTFPPYNLDDH